MSNNIISIFDLNLDISDKINKEVIKLKKLKIVKEKQKEYKLKLLDHLNMISEILTNNGHKDINYVLEDTDLLEGEFCNEYLLEDEYERLQEERFQEYYGL